ncbi:hypothetical protein [Hydrogenophaga sp. T2]|uniref:hypothetical protein n=1 Tax=Hydrogenophaga sp. T2 TaxID=3132823 RepID=UPI003CF8F306
MNNKLTDRERRHLQRVKELDCSVCDAPGPSEAHHIRQGDQYTAIALCPECHRGPSMGWHGGRIAWRVRKMDELQALNVTLKRLLNP